MQKLVNSLIERSAHNPILQAALFAIDQLFESEYTPVPIFVSDTLPIVASLAVWVSIMSRCRGQSLTKVVEPYPDRPLMLS